MSDPYAIETRLSGSLHLRDDPGGKRPAELQISPAGIRARTDSGREIEIAWRGVRLTSTDGEVTVISADRSAAVSSDDPEFMRALEAAGGNDLNDALSRLQGERVSNRLKHTLGCLAILLVVVLIGWGVPMLFRAAVGATVDSLPYEVDQAIGESVWGQMDLGGEEVDDPVVRDAIQVMLDRLAPHRSLEEAEFTFKVIDSEVINAFALPGGFIVVFTGLMCEADSPEQVAGVIAHEIAHVTERHGLRRLAHGLGIWAAVSLVSGNTDILTSMALELFTLTRVNDYSQDQESEADLEGTRMLVAARIDPAGLADFFAKLEAQGGELPDSLAWFSSHPQHRERVRAIQAHAAELGAPEEYEPLDLDWEAVLAALE